jgi:hypothetical protein
MKNLNYAVLLFLSIAALAIACKDDDAGTQAPANMLSFEGKDHPLKWTLAEWDNTAEAGPVDGKLMYRHNIGLMGEGLTADLQGKATVLSMKLISASAAEITGSYDFNHDDNEDQDAPGKMFGDLLVDYDFANGTSGGKEYRLEGGKVVVSRAGDIYTFEVSFQANGSSGKAYFSGKLNDFK